MDCFTKLWTVKLGDWERGLIVAILTTPITIALDSLNQGALEFNWKKILAAGLAGGLAYILKNLLTGQNGRLLSNK